MSNIKTLHHKSWLLYCYRCDMKTGKLIIIALKPTNLSWHSSKFNDQLSTFYTTCGDLKPSGQGYTQLKVALNFILAENWIATQLDFCIDVQRRVETWVRKAIRKCIYWGGDRINGSLIFFFLSHLTFSLVLTLMYILMMNQLEHLYDCQSFLTWGLNKIVCWKFYWCIVETGRLEAKLILNNDSGLDSWQAQKLYKCSPRRCFLSSWIHPRFLPWGFRHLMVTVFSFHNFFISLVTDG